MKSIKILCVFVFMITAFTTGCGSDQASETAASTSTASGLTITSNKLVSASATNLCTQFATESCFFKGGQRLVYSDGSIFITGSFVYIDSSTGDSDTNTISIMIPPSTAASYQVLSYLVARGAGYKRLFLVYGRSPESILLVHDTTGDGAAGSGDTTLLTATLTDW